MEAKTSDQLDNITKFLGPDLTAMLLRSVLADMTLDDLAKMAERQAVQRPHHGARRPKINRKPVSVPAEWGGKMRDALKVVFANGPVPIAKIATALQATGIIPDTSPETKKKICEYIASDKTFSCKTRGVYAIRSQP